MTLFATIAERKAQTAALKQEMRDLESGVNDMADFVGSLDDINTDLYDLERQLRADAAAFYNLLVTYCEERMRLEADQLAQINEAQSDRRELGEGPMQHERV